jgi:YVTN family beta-propeller protein
LSGPEGLTVANDLVFVANEGAGTVDVFRPDGELVSTLPVGDYPENVGTGPDGRVWVTNYSYVHPELRGSVSVIDPVAIRLMRTIEVGRGPQGIAFSVDEALAYVVNSFDETISVVSIGSLSVVDTVAAGGAPQGIAVVSGDAGDEHVFVTNDE